MTYPTVVTDPCSPAGFTEPGIPDPALASGVWFDDDPNMSVPTAAGVCNALYGGFHNSTESRRLAQDVQQAWPPLRDHIYAGRTLLRRMVQHLIAAGVDQFIDIGCGVAQCGATHEVIADIVADPAATLTADPAPAGGAAQRARVVYADLDPIVTGVNRHHVRDLGWVRAVVGDVRQPHQILDDAVVNDLLDLGRPVAVLLLGVLHHLPPDTDHAEVLRGIADALVPGSYLAVSFLTTDPDPRGAEDQRHAAELFARTPTPLYLQAPQEIADLLQNPQLPGWQLVAPGLVPAHRWRADPDDDPGFPAPQLFAALARLGPAAGTRVPTDHEEVAC